MKDEEEISSVNETSSNDSNEWQRFGLSDKVLKALNDLKFKEPTPIQKQCLLPAIRDKMDILGAAETGSGKTLAFALPVIQSILDIDSSEKENRCAPLALILTPTRELAIQIKEHIVATLKYTEIKVASIIGGLSVQKQERVLKKRPEIIVATPGRLWAMMQEGLSDYLRNISEIRYLVIDETDRMVEKGHFEELSHILDVIKGEEQNLEMNKSDHRRQTFVFSATLAFVHPPPKRLASKSEVRQMTPKQKIEMIVALTRLRKERKVVDITRSFGTAESLLETKITCETLQEKDTYLYYFLVKYPGRTLIFANSIDSTRRLKNLLTRLKYNPLVLNAQMHQKQRLKSLEKFADAEKAILLATDVAARGLDIKNIDHVVHYHVPRTAEIYVHRSGRTARANKEGLSVMLVDSQDALNYRKICKNLNRDQDLANFPVIYDLISFLTHRVKLASEIESLEHQVSKNAATKNWFKRAAKEADFDDEDDHRRRRNSSDEEDVIDGSSEKKSHIKSMTKRLNALLNQPLPRNSVFTTKYPTAIADIYQHLESEKTSVPSALDAAKKEVERPKEKKIFIKSLTFKDRKMKLKNKPSKGKRKRR